MSFLKYKEDASVYLVTGYLGIKDNTPLYIMCFELNKHKRGDEGVEKVICFSFMHKNCI